MTRFALFIEASGGEPCVPIVRHTMRALYAQGVTYWPFAASLTDLRDILKTLQQRNEKPSLFVLNTFGTEKILPTVDFLMGETPALFFRRQLYWLHEGGGESDAGSTHFSSILKKMTPRLTSVWRFGGANAKDVAQLASRCIAQYLADGAFRHLEYQSQKREFDLSDPHQAWQRTLGATT